MTSGQEDIENCTRRLLEKQRVRLAATATRAKREKWSVFVNDPGYPEEHFRQICTAESVHGRKKIELGSGRKRKRQTRKRMKKKHHTRKKSRKHLRHKKTKKHRRHKNVAGGGIDEWNRLNDTYNTIREQELQVQAEIARLNKIIRNWNFSEKKRNAAMKTRTKYENELRTLEAAARAAHEAKEQEELNDPYSDLT